MSMNKLHFCLCRLFGIWSARRLYDALSLYLQAASTSLCMLHNAEPRRPCPHSSHFCGNESKVPVLNFDAVKNEFCRERGNRQFKSVDAVTFKGSQFLFIEIKSWQNFEANHIKKGESPSVVKQKIERQASDFNLKKKVEDSIKICTDLTKCSKLFSKFPVLYVLVTDVNDVVDPLARLKGWLDVLSYNSVRIPDYKRATEKELHLTGMTTRYQPCRDFDRFFDSL